MTILPGISPLINGLPYSISLNSEWDDENSGLLVDNILMKIQEK
jgi:hypothetical protein